MNSLSQIGDIIAAARPNGFLIVVSYPILMRVPDGIEKARTEMSIPRDAAAPRVDVGILVAPTPQRLIVSSHPAEELRVYRPRAAAVPALPEAGDGREPRALLKNLPRHLGKPVSVWTNVRVDERENLTTRLSRATVLRSAAVELDGIGEDLNRQESMVIDRLAPAERVLRATVIHHNHFVLEVASLIEHGRERLLQVVQSPLAGNHHRRYRGCD